MSYVHEKYEQSQKGKKNNKAVVAMLCKVKTISLLRVFYFIFLVLEKNILLKHEIIATWKSKKKYCI